jgi:hypothetical protein
MNEEDMSIFDDEYEEDAHFDDAGDLVPFNIDNDDQPTDSDSELDLSIQGMAQLNDFDNDDDDDSSNQDTPPLTENALIDDVLSAKGIINHTIQYEDTDGNIEEVDFYTLSREEQLAILNSTDKDINYDLEDTEVEAVNFLRDNGVTLEEAIDYFKRQAVEEYIDSQNIAGIEVDQYSDEQLFALDMKARYEDLTDDEIAIEIEKQLEHPDLFKKKIDKLRTDYKEIEIGQLQQAKAKEESDNQQRFEALQDNLITVAESIEDIGGLDLDNNDKNEILSFILEKDINGISPLIKSLDSPEKLFELAWYATKGKEAFGILHDYYKKQIDSVRKSSYEKGTQDAIKKPTNTNTDRKSYVKPIGNAKPQTNSKILHINDLSID